MTHEPHQRESASANLPTVGFQVVTSDGEELGTVKDVTADAFKVDAPRERDYWLSNALIQPASGRESAITMMFEAEAVDAHKLPGPAPVTADDPIADAEGDQFASRAERARTRHDMKLGHEEESGRQESA